MKSTLLPSRSALLFVLTGGLTTLLHLGVAIAMVERFGLDPLAANLVGWLASFPLSLLGHLRLTFRAADAPLWRSARRFFLVSAAGFTVNEVSYFVLLRLSGLGYALALAVVLACVAAASYQLSRRWAFLGKTST
jgi:putative flippase GtrA